MDGVIADLQADRPVRSTVADLAAARRRRRARGLLVAAAAVVVAGIAIDQLRGADLSGGGGDGGSSSVAGDQADPGAESGAGGGAGQQPASEPSSRAFDDEPARLDARSFARQAAKLRTSMAARNQTDYGSHESLDATDGLIASPAPTCSLPDVGRGRVVAVRYDGAPGALVFRRPTGDSQVVDLYLCGRGEPVRSVTLPAP
jgi:hypothetical protein